MSVTWNDTFKDKPEGGQNAGLLDNFIRETREAVEDRIEREHEMKSDVAVTLDGSHKRGSARCHVSSGAPTPGTMEAEDVADTTRAIGRQWFDTDDRVLRIYDGTSWVPIGAYYGQIVYFTGDVTPPTGFVECVDANDGTYSDGTTTVHVPDLEDTFIRSGAGYAAGFTTGGEDSVTLVDVNIPDHVHGMDHEHNFHGDGSDGIGDNTGIRYTQDGSGTKSEDVNTGQKWMSPPNVSGSSATRMPNTDSFGEETPTAVATIPAYTELKAYCYVGALPLT